MTDKTSYLTSGTILLGTAGLLLVALRAGAADGSTYIALKLVFESIIMPPLWNSLW